MANLTDAAAATDLSDLVADPLRYQNRLRFPAALERAYRRYLADRLIVMQRHFIAFGFVIFGLFAVLDYFALPRTHSQAWMLRALVEPLIIVLFWASFKPALRPHMHWILNAWTLVMNGTILGMIAGAQESELAFTFYPIGLLLVLICGYVASGHLGYATAQGWLAFLGYLAVAIFDQRMLVGSMSLFKLLTLSFFLVGMNLVGMALGFALELSNRLMFLQWLVIDRQHRQANRLLLNILPASVAERLKRGEVVADYFDRVGVLFADIEGFTPYSSGKAPSEVVDVLNKVFCEFDVLTQKYGLEKIKTIGDAYMVVSGLQGCCEDHLAALASLALEMQSLMRTFQQRGTLHLRLRVGMHAGPAMASIIGIKKFSYDLWGDTVNVASRMESCGLPGQIQVTRDLYLLLKRDFSLQKRGRIPVKGKGEMAVYLLKGRCSHASAGAFATAAAPAPRPAS
jgi:class 3 adenylate cyclase